MLSVSPASIAANPGDANNLNWSFNSTPQAFDFLAAGEKLTLTYTVKAADGHSVDSPRRSPVITGTETRRTSPLSPATAPPAARRDQRRAEHERHAHGDRCGSFRHRDPVGELGGASGRSTGWLRQRALGMLSVSPGSIAANPGDANNLNWSLNSRRRPSTSWRRARS